MHLLDSNICIYYLKGLFPALKTRFDYYTPATIAIPAIVKADLYFGANKSQNKERTLRILDAFLAPLTIIPFGDKEAVLCALIRADIELKGLSIGPNDLFIAATTLARGAIIVTHNVNEFKRVFGLVWEDWTV